MLLGLSTFVETELPFSFILFFVEDYNWLKILPQRLCSSIYGWGYFIFAEKCTNWTTYKRYSQTFFFPISINLSARFFTCRMQSMLCFQKDKMLDKMIIFYIHFYADYIPYLDVISVYILFFTYWIELEHVVVSILEI